MNDFLINEGIPVTLLSSNMLLFRDSSKPFKLGGDLLEKCLCLILTVLLQLVINCFVLFCSVLFCLIWIACFLNESKL